MKLGFYLWATSLNCNIENSVEWDTCNWYSMIEIAYWLTIESFVNIDNSDGIRTFWLISNCEREPIMIELIKVIDNELN